MPHTLSPLPATDAAMPRPAAVRWAADLLALSSVVFLDTETTGLGERAEIVEIAVLDASGKVLLDTLVRPEGRIPAEVIAIHGIDNRMVADAPRWPEVYPLVVQALAKRTVVVYNAAFDARMLAQMNARHGLPQVAEEWHCAMQGYGAWVGRRHPRYGNFRWHKLDAALSAFGHACGPDAHRARSDANACRLVMHGIAASPP